MVPSTPRVTQKDRVEANIGRSSTKVLTKPAVPVVSGFKLAPRPGIFTVLDLHKIEVPLIGWELTRVLDSRRRLVGWYCC